MGIQRRQGLHTSIELQIPLALIRLEKDNCIAILDEELKGWHCQPKSVAFRGFGSPELDVMQAAQLRMLI